MRQLEENSQIHISAPTTERYLGGKQKLRITVYDDIGVEPTDLLLSHPWGQLQSTLATYGDIRQNLRPKEICAGSRQRTLHRLRLGVFAADCDTETGSGYWPDNTERPLETPIC
jgi:hypothetical protein